MYQWYSQKSRLRKPIPISNSGIKIQHYTGPDDIFYVINAGHGDWSIKIESNVHLVDDNNNNNNNYNK